MHLPQSLPCLLANFNQVWQTRSSLEAGQIYKGSAGPIPPSSRSSPQAVLRDTSPLVGGPTTHRLRGGEEGWEIVFTEG